MSQPERSLMGRDIDKERAGQSCWDGLSNLKAFAPRCSWLNQQTLGGGTQGQPSMPPAAAQLEPGAQRPFSVGGGAWGELCVAEAPARCSWIEDTSVTVSPLTPPMASWNCPEVHYSPQHLSQVCLWGNPQPRAWPRLWCGVIFLCLHLQCPHWSSGERGPRDPPGLS